MDWTRLLSQRRVASDGTLDAPADDGLRTADERDWDRILFSTAFRRMHDKTQVFPLPTDDVVHSRLTHSLEVSSVGRTLGARVEDELVARGFLSKQRPHGIGNIVKTACLAHDIGNPPFGHAGEAAIAEYFRSEAGKAATAALTAQQRADLEQFEGNAQGLRILSRLQLEDGGGMRLTTATLAAFTKYPRAAGEGLHVPGLVSTKKHGFCQAEQHIFGTVAGEAGLLPRISTGGARQWCRHPLAFLVEAADDICYSILDLEDGARLRLLPLEEAQIAMSTIGKQWKGHDPKKAARASSSLQGLGYMRAMAITQLTAECVDAFMANHDGMLSGTFDSALCDVVPHAAELTELKKLALRNCYRSPRVLEIELAGYEVLGGLLTLFIPAVLNPSKGSREHKALQFLQARGVPLGEEHRYERLMRVVDFVSGMTDRYALGTYRNLAGISIPGSA